MKTSIYEFLKKHAEKNPVSFHMPGHKGSDLYKKLGYESFMRDFLDYDITEIPGADNLFQTEGILKETQDRYAKLYGVKKSYLLINGTSGGIIAAILASAVKSKKLIMARNSHKSVFNALTLGQIQPIYAYPDMIADHGISGSVSAGEIERLLNENPDADAVILPSPNYYGICSPIRDIAEVVHRHNKILIVDEAHGAHLKLFESINNTSNNKKNLQLPKSAVSLGADIVINSIHKTLASLTQSAVLHLNSNRVDQYLLEDKLQCIESTSPSYILMASLDISADILEEHGMQLMEEWKDNIENFYNRATQIPGLQIINNLKGLDWTKINLNMSGAGLSGAELEKILIEDYGIYTELVTGDVLMAMSGIGNIKQDYEKLAKALEEISYKYYKIKNEKNNDKKRKLNLPKQAKLFDIPKEKKKIKLEDAEGYLCASSIIPYPPGIPILCPGELIEKGVIEYIKALRFSGEKVIGVNELGEIIVSYDKYNK
ncbi:aminotransferase class I/II-fold pyridoxal phosphate-dependent enzyme [Anaerovorax odorimutans]|uniref:aminotransferase class I/II-fold pyridoxal phosphate-dependent enzyme n=1 Tax=Anaerovorax odorimutans TaxID=109327 RepID=UPI000428F81C|nr:aminotransferase class I/II-fold pyridoxal phosphate-dependent enzyme [Anaerovorax odorimutans]